MAKMILEKIRMVDVPLPAVSVITPTEDRQAFLPWAAWNLAKQHKESGPRIEWIVVTSNPLQALALVATAAAAITIKVTGSDYHASIGEKFNLGLQIATGDLVLKVDDDDWQHEDRINRIARRWMETGGPDVIGTHHAGFVDLFNRKVAPYRCAEIPHSLCAVRREVYTALPMPDASLSEDSRWIKMAKRRGFRFQSLIDAEPHALWLSHGGNTTLARREHENYHKPLSDFIPPGQLAVTSQRMAELDSRLRGLKAPEGPFIHPG